MTNYTRIMERAAIRKWVRGTETRFVADKCIRWLTSFLTVLSLIPDALGAEPASTTPSPSIHPFEVLFGRFVMGASWERLAADYNRA
jgi:hypothetical protein